MKFFDFLKYKPKETYKFTIPENSNNLPEENNIKQKIFSNIDNNLNYLNNKYSLLINSDIVTKEFKITIQNKNYKAILIFIDGMVNTNSINDFILKPIMLKNSILMKSFSPRTINLSKNQINLENFLYESLIPQNSIKKSKNFDDLIEKINSGFSALFIDTLDIAFCIEARDLKVRSISPPQNESVVKGSQEGFVENIRVNTSLVRKIVNNENLIIEEINVGKISKTKVAILYMKNITNDSLVSEVKYRINNLDIDYLTSSGQLEQLIQDNKLSPFPQVLSTERPDRVSNNLFAGRIAIIVNGTPFALIVPGIFTDFIVSPEDENLNSIFANFLRIIRCIAIFFALFLPGFYVAITNFHQELIPSELLFAISSSREAIPFPVIFEIILMEVSFELIREAGLRISSSFSTTVGIIGALILGDAAVSANIVSPILIIIVAFTGICSFSIPDFSLGFALRIFRFMYIILGYIAGFLGIAFGAFIQFLLLNNINSFGISYFTPFLPIDKLFTDSGAFLKPFWKRENRNSYLNTKRPIQENDISMKWRLNGK